MSISFHHGEQVDASETKSRNLQMKTVNFNLKNVSCMLDDIQSSSFLKSLTIHGLTTLPSVFKNVPVLRDLELSNAFADVKSYVQDHPN